MKTMPILTEKYAAEGERVTCEAGHIVAIFKRDVYKSEPSDIDHLRWFGKRPRIGDAFTPCSCGAHYVRAGKAGMELHFSLGGWRK